MAQIRSGRTAERRRRREKSENKNEKKKNAENDLQKRLGNYFWILSAERSAKEPTRKRTFNVTFAKPYKESIAKQFSEREIRQKK
jgi:hypothetical protein